MAGKIGSAFPMTRGYGAGLVFLRSERGSEGRGHSVCTNTGLYRSRDGGKTFSVLKGEPGGDDYHQLWIDADEPQRMILGSDQGAVVTRNGGETWSSWYNQPTGQFYHVATDNQFRIGSMGAADSGAAATPSRSKYRSLNFHDCGRWMRAMRMATSHRIR